MIRKINSIFCLFKQKDAEGVEVWVVSWVARYGDYSTDTKRVYKAFLSKEDAEAFANSLYAAQRLLQSTNDLGVRIEKQK
jgi:hypothetical protein